MFNHLGTSLISLGLERVNVRGVRHEYEVNKELSIKVRSNHIVCRGKEILIDEETGITVR